MSGILAKSGRTSSRMKRVLKQAQAQSQSPGVFLRTSTHMASSTLDPSTLANESLAERILSGTERLGAASINEDVMKTFVGTLHAASSFAQHHQSSWLNLTKPVSDCVPISNNQLLSPFDQGGNAVLQKMESRQNISEKSKTLPTVHTAQANAKRKEHNLEKRLQQAVKSHRVGEMLEIFGKIMDNNAIKELDLHIYQNLIRVAVKKDVVGAYNCLKRYEQITGHLSDPQVYGYICKNLDKFDPGQVRPQYLENMTKSIVSRVSDVESLLYEWRNLVGETGFIVIYSGKRDIKHLAANSTVTSLLPPQS
mmetsp:Transcript_13710/g.21399  ORF Transcript_13710/g.21399 Transcript_13710/m.21399 type:complete len:309 (-) Transcript_13710:207-1133(-)